MLWITIIKQFVKKNNKKVFFLKKNPKNQPKSAKKVKNLKNLKICKKTCFRPQNDFFLKLNSIANVFYKKRVKIRFFLEKWRKVFFGTKKIPKKCFFEKIDQKGDFFLKKNLIYGKFIYFHYIMQIFIRYGHFIMILWFF